MDTVQRLNEEAHRTNKTLVDVCNAAFPTLVDKTKLEIENLGKGADATVAVVTPDKSAAADALSAMQARLVELTAKLERSPGDLATIAASAQAYEDYGLRRLNDRQSRDGADALREAVRLREKLAREQPSVLEHREHLVATLTWLGKAHVQLKDHYAASNSFLRRLDLLEQLEHEQPSPSRRTAIADTHLMFGELAEVRGDRVEALIWFARATQEESEQATTKVAYLLQASAGLSELLPPDLKAVYNRLLKQGKSTGHPVFVNSFLSEARNAWKFARLQREASEWHVLALAHEAKKQTEQYRAALFKEYDLRTQQMDLDNTHVGVKSARLDAALRQARSYLDAKQMSEAALWTERAALLDDVDSLLRFADWCEKGEVVKRDTEKATRYRYLGHYLRGWRAENELHFAAAAVDFAFACELTLATAGDFSLLAICYGKVGRFDDAIAACTRGIDLDLKSDKHAYPGINILLLLESLTCSERFDQLSQLVESIEKKGWKPPETDDANAARYGAFFHGLHAIAQRIRARILPTPSARMREFTGKPEFASVGWSWNGLDQWVKTTKLAPEIRAQAERIFGELKGTPEALFLLADRFENGTEVKADLQRANHFRYLGYSKRGNQLFGERRYTSALPDLEKVCESAEATPDDRNQLATCYGKLGRWDDAIKEYIRSIDADLNSQDAQSIILNLLEALTCAEHFEQLLQFVDTIEKKGWRLPPDDSASGRHNAFFYGFKAIAQRMTGKDPSGAERMMRQLTGRPGYKESNWTWEELNGWLKTTKLAPDRKAAAEKIVAELKGDKAP